MEQFPWVLAIVGGPLLLAILIAFAMLRRRPLTPGERVAQHRAVEREYDEAPPPPHARADGADRARHENRV